MCPQWEIQQCTSDLTDEVGDTSGENMEEMWVIFTQEEKPLMKYGKPEVTKYVIYSVEMLPWNWGLQMRPFCAMDEALVHSPVQKRLFAY